MNASKMLKKDIIKSICIVLCFVGISLGGVVKLIIGENIVWLAMVISAVSTLGLIPRKKPIFQSISWEVFSIFLFSVYTIGLAFYQGIPFWSDTVGLAYQLVYLLQIVLLWNIARDYDISQVIKVGFGILGVSTFIVLYFLVTNDITAGFGVLLSKIEETSTSPVSRATTAFIGYFGYLFALTFVCNSRKKSVARIVIILSSLMVIFLSTRRSVLLATFISTIIHLKNKYSIESQKRLLNQLAGWFLLLFVIVVFVMTNQYIRENVLYAFDSFMRGLTTYTGYDDSDLAASYRYERIITIPKEYFNSSVAQFLFGRGYNSDWLDIPFLQAFWDLGLFGGIWFLIIQGIRPLTHLMKKPVNNITEFAQYYALLRIVQNFSNGTPYGNFLPIVFLYTVEAINAHSALSQANEQNVSDPEEVLNVS